MFAYPYILSKGKNIIPTNQRFIRADTGEMVPLMNRRAQIDDILSGNMNYAITARPNRFSRKTFSNVLDKNNPDYTYNVPHRWGTWNVGESFPTAKIFLNSVQGRKGGSPNVEVLKKGRGFETIKLSQHIKNKIYYQLDNNNKLTPELSKYLFQEAQKQATKLSLQRGHRVLVGTLSPKRTKGFQQAEMEMSLVAPQGNHKMPSLKFGGFVEGGAIPARIYTEGKRNLIKDLFR